MFKGRRRPTRSPEVHAPTFSELLARQSDKPPVATEDEATTHAVDETPPQRDNFDALVRNGLANARAC